MDFESELAENELEFMAKDMRTQPTSLSSTLESQNLDSGLFVFGFFSYFTCFETQNVFLQFYLINLGRE